jgi:putative methyltransferase
VTKLLFYYSSPCNDNQIFLGTANLYLKTYIDITDSKLAANLEWLLPQQRELSDSELIALCNQQQIDFLCTSHYIWNHQNLLDQLKRIKPYLNNNIKVIAGGPSISVNIDPNFLSNNSEIDYAVYGPGERAFYDLMSAVINQKKLQAFSTSNIAWQKDNKQIVASYRYVSMLEQSPFIHNKELFTAMVGQEQEQGYNAAIPYELTRGCPYACTFCDWNSGLSNKVSRRKNSYEADIDLFHKLKVYTIFLSDANVGQYAEDINMIEYFAKLNLEHGAEFTLMGNYSKLKKENNLKIYHLLAQGKLLNQGFVISCQDINANVLSNIDRPDITWVEHAKMIDELNDSYPHIPSQVQLIQGLPGQTVDTWHSTLRELAKRPLVLEIFINELLPTSPAARDQTYQTQFNFTYSHSLRWMSRVGAFFRGEFSKSCNSFSKEDFVRMSLLSHFYGAVCVVKFLYKQYHSSFDLDRIVESFLNSSIYIQLEKNLLDNWSQDKFFYTINFDGSPAVISACYAMETIDQWVNSTGFQKFMLSQVNDKNFKKEYLHVEFQSVYDSKKRFSLSID